MTETHHRGLGLEPEQVDGDGESVNDQAPAVHDDKGPAQKAQVEVGGADVGRVGDDGDAGLLVHGHLAPLLGKEVVFLGEI